MATLIIVCEHCGNSIENPKHRKRFCSQLCKIHAHQKRHRTMYPERAKLRKREWRKRRHIVRMADCAECGQSFRAKRSDHRFCSMLCKQRWSSRDFKQRYPEKVRESYRKWLEQNRDKVYAANRERARTPKVRIRKNADYLAKRIAAAGRPPANICDLCGMQTMKSHFDHDHETGQFRGWLCQRCNTTLGKVKESIELLHQMIQYLEQWHSDQNQPECVTVSTIESM